MQTSSEFCWAQQANHAQRAVDSQLANVRAIATSAAAAWGAEALSAERRELRLVKREAESANILAMAEDQSVSENPDRGVADRL